MFRLRKRKPATAPPSLAVGAPVPFDGDPDGPRPDIAEYGWLEKGALWPADRSLLLARCRTPGGAPPRVWAPEHERMVEPFRVGWIFEAVIREPSLVKLLEQVKAWGFLFGLFCILTLVILAESGGELANGPPIMLVFTGLSFAQSLLEYRRVKRMTPESFAADVDELMALPVARQGKPVVTRALMAAIGIVALAQVASPGSSVDAAGLVKDAVREGEWWRLFTAPLMHGNFMHLLMNGSALLALGTLVERYAHRVFVPLVFLVAALAGGAGSFVAFPHTPSLGASGGILGLVGFALVVAQRRRELLPRSLGKALLQDVGWIALMGLFAYQYIDNGAHAAGLLAGIAVGLALVPRGGEVPHWEPASAVRIAGWAAAAVIAASTVVACAAMFALPRI